MVVIEKQNCIYKCRFAILRFVKVNLMKENHDLHNLRSPINRYFCYSHCGFRVFGFE